MSLYDDLRVSADADEAAIKRAYRKQAKAAHPDAGGSVEEFRRIEIAKSVLTDPERRRKYDATGEIDEGRAANAEDRQMGAALNALAQAFEVTLQAAMKGPDPAQTDFVVLMRRHLGECCSKARVTADQIRAQLGRVDRLRDRFKTKQGPNRLDAIVKGRCADLAQQVAKVEADIATWTMALEILKGYSFAVEPVAESQATPLGLAMLQQMQMAQGWARR